jgi:hypothetical protein
MVFHTISENELNDTDCGMPSYSDIRHTMLRPSVYLSGTEDAGMDFP